MSRTSSQGFTLIELLIALAISAILAVGTFYLVQASRQTQTTLVERNESRSQLTRVIRTLETDIRQWVPARPVRDAFGQEIPALVMDQDGLTLTRSGWALSQVIARLDNSSTFTSTPRSQMQRVRYRLAEPGSELCPLVDIDADNLDSRGDSPSACLIRSYRLQLDDDGRLEWRHQRLLQPIERLQWRFLAQLGDERRFFDSWPPESPEVLTAEPVLIAIDVHLHLPEGDINRLIAVPGLPGSREAGDATN